MKDEFILGIDLGTTNSCASVVLDGQPFIISNEDGETIVPSVVVLKNDQMIVGNDAKDLLLEDNIEVIYSIKRLMGSKEKIKIGNMQYTPEQISSMILLYIKNRCEMALNTKIKKAVITVPAYFHDGQRQATINAGKIAGIDVLRIINEPTAAAIAYGFQKEGAENKNILVYDLGGGTFDVSILKITKDFFEVLSTSGDNFLGGDDWDKRIFDWIIEEIKKQYNIDLDVNNVNIVNKLKSYSEFIKKALSNADEVNIDFEPITNLKDCTKVFSKAEFEYRTKDLMERTKKPVEDAIKESKLTIDEIDMAVLVGGSTRMPMIYDYVYNLFNGRVANDINPDEVVALGAAIQGAILKGEVNIQVQDVTPLTLGLETYDGLTVPILPRNSKIPTTVKQIFTTNFDNQTKIDINIVQGERKLAKDNRLLSNFEFTDIPLAKQGEPSIEISYIIDANGVLSVQAKDLDTNKQTKVIVKDNSGLSSKDISKMISEAQRLKEQDIKKLDDIRIYQIAYEYLNILIEYVNTELNDIIPFYNRERSLKWIADFSKWIEEKDYDALRKKLFAFQLHVNISLHPRIKQGQDKIGFKN